MNQDFTDLLRLFAEHEVEYLVAGGYAVIHHTQPRFTKDIDLWIKPSPGNSHKIEKVFTAFGLPLGGEITREDFETEGVQFVIGIAPSAIDFLTTISGLDFNQAWKNRATDHSLGFPVHYIGLEDMIIAKKTAGRQTDLADLEELKRKQSLPPN